MNRKVKKIIKSYLLAALITFAGLLFTGITGLSKTGLKEPFNIVDDIKIFIKDPLPSLLSFLILSTLLGVLFYFTSKHKKN